MCMCFVKKGKPVLRKKVMSVVRMIEETRVSVHARTYVHLAKNVRNLSLQRQVPGD